MCVCVLRPINFSPRFLDPPVHPNLMEFETLVLKETFPAIPASIRVDSPMLTEPMYKHITGIDSFCPASVTKLQTVTDYFSTINICICVMGLMLPPLYAEVYIQPTADIERMMHAPRFNLEDAHIFVLLINTLNSSLRSEME